MTTTQTSQWREMLAQIRSDAALALLALLTLVLPLYRTGVLEDSYIIPKVEMAAVFGCALVGILCARAYQGRTQGWPKWQGVGGVLLCFVAIHALSMLWARSFSLALHATAYLISFTLLYFAALFSLRNARHLRIILYAGIWAAALTAIWTLAEDFLARTGFEHLVTRLPDWRGYLAAGLGNSGHIAGFIGLFLPSAILLFLRAPRFGWLLFAAIVLMFGALTITWSVGSTGSTLLALGIWCAVTFACALHRQLHWGRLAALLAAGVFVMAFYFLPHPLNPHSPSLWSEAFGSKRWAEGGPTRLVIYKTTWHMITQHPLLGIGAGNFTFGYVQQVVPSVIADPALRIYAGSFTNEAHNEYLQIWCETGIVGLLVYLALLLVYFVRVGSLLRGRVEAEDKLLAVAAAAGVTVFLLDSLMTFPLRLPSHIAVLMLLLAVPGVLARRGGEESCVAAPVASPASSPEEDFPEFVERKAASRPKADTPRLLLLGVLLALGCAALGIHTRRIVAEFYLKQARALAESEVAILAGQQTTSWVAADQAFSVGGRYLAEGETQEASRMFAMAQTLLKKSDGVRASEEDFKKALAWDPHYTNASSRYGALLLMRGDYKQAVPMLERTLEDLESPEVHERLGFAHYFLGDKAQAVRQWQLLVERRPQMRAYYEKLVRLAQK